MRALSGLGNKRLVRAISRSSEEWKKVGWDFVFRTADISIATVFETQLTGGIMVVDQDSARLGLFGERTGGLPRSDHRTICKFGDNQDESNRFFVLGNFATWIAECALQKAIQSPLDVIEELAADEELMQSLALTHPQHQLRVTCALFSAVGQHQVESVIRRYPHLVCQVQRKLSSNSLDDSLAGSDNFIPEQYSVDTLAPRFLDRKGVLFYGRIVKFQTWWLQSPRRWRRIRVSVAGVFNRNNPLDVTQTKLLYMLLNLTHGGVPLLNFLLGHYLVEQDLSGWETSIKIIASSPRGFLDVLGLNFLSNNFSIEARSQDISKDSVRRTQRILELGCHTYREGNIAMEARLSGLTCKVRLRGKACAQKQMPFRRRLHAAPDDYNIKSFFFEIEAFRKLHGCKRISEFVGVVLDDNQRYIKSFLRAWEPHTVTDLLRQSVKASKPIPWPSTERWAKQIVEAVSFAHSNKVILGRLHLGYFGVNDQNNISLLHIRNEPPATIHGWSPPECRNDRFTPTRESDIYQLGLLLWLLTDFSAAIPSSKYSFPKETVFWERRVRPDTTYEGRPVDLPPCQLHVPLYYQAIVKMCRQELPSDRKAASELLLHFPGQSLNCQSTAYYHRLAYGDIQNSPWMFPPPTDRLEDLHIDNDSPGLPRNIEISGFL
ncbi:uncharacterized protein TrAFT101_009353 [Trichoderma asperellum]|nr:hypothetical protein TrAFT101_009353 [Trichoderma asperellum]